MIDYYGSGRFPDRKTWLKKNVRVPLCLACERLRQTSFGDGCASSSLLCNHGVGVAWQWERRTVSRCDVQHGQNLARARCRCLVGSLWTRVCCLGGEKASVLATWSGWQTRVSREQCRSPGSGGVQEGVTVWEAPASPQPLSFLCHPRENLSLFCEPTLQSLKIDLQGLKLESLRPFMLWERLAWVS